MRDWPLILVASLLLLGGGVKAAADGDLGALTGSLLAAGMVVLGSWIAVEVRRTKNTSNDEPKD